MFSLQKNGLLFSQIDSQQENAIAENFLNQVHNNCY